MNKLSFSKKIITILLGITFIFAFGFMAFSFNGVFAVQAAVKTDYDILSENSNFFCEANDAGDYDSAKAYTENYIDGLGIQTDYSVENEKFIAPQVGMDGYYSFAVRFSGESRKAVACLLSINAYEKPLVLDFRDPSCIAACTTSNGTITSDNGKLRLTSRVATRDDGFFLTFYMASLSSNPVYGEKLPYLKVKYKTTCDKVSPTFQVFYWKADGTVNYRTFSVSSGSTDGHNITLIIDLSIINTDDPAIWRYDEDDATLTRIKYSVSGYGPTSAYYGVTYTGAIDQIRFNFARNGSNANPLNRTTVVDYLGFFPTIDSAKSFVPTENNFDDNAKQLTNKPLTSIYGDAYDLKSAESTAVMAVANEYGLNCSIIRSDYTPSTETQEGKLVFDAVFLNAGKTEIVSDITMVIDKKPSEGIILDLGDEDLVSKFSYGRVDHCQEDGYLKIVSNAPEFDDGFYFHVGFGDSSKNEHEKFNLQDYPFVILRYKREGVGGGQLFFWTEGAVGDVPLVELYLGKNEGHWYTSILCTRVKSYDIPLIINYDEQTGEIEEVKTLVKYGIKAAEFKGVVEKIRFNFGRQKCLERTAWIDYIGFFATYQDAQSYFAEKALNEYSGESLSYFEGDTENIAIETVNGILRDRCGNGLFSVISETVSYIAPTLTAKGKLVVNVSVKGEDDTLLFTRNGIEFDIDNHIDNTPSEFVFVNPYMIRTISGSHPECINFSKMRISDVDASFTLKIAEDSRFFAREKQFALIKIDATVQKFTFKANNSEYTIELNDPINGESRIIIDLMTGDYYINGSTKSGTASVATLPKGRITKFGMCFDCYPAADFDIYYISFFSTLGEACAYTGHSPSASLDGIVQNIEALDFSCVYEDGYSEMKAVKTVRKKIEDGVKGEYKIYDIDTVSFTESTTTSAGRLDFKVYIYSGDMYSADFRILELSMPIDLKDKEVSNGQTDTDGGFRLTNEKGHEFYGGIGKNAEYVYAAKSISGATTFEWIMQVSEDTLTGTYRIINNSDYSFDISLVDGQLNFKDGEIEFATSNLSVADGEYHHIAVVISDKAYLYVDGILFDSYVITGSKLSEINNIYIGRGNVVVVGGKNTYENYFAGRLADIRIWNYARSAQDLSSNKDNYVAGDSVGLIASWHLDEQVLLEGLVRNDRGYYSDSMGYIDYSVNENYGVFYSNGYYYLENIVTDYTIIQISDTQNYMFPDVSFNKGKTPADYYDEMYGWMQDNAENLNLVLVDHLGDVCQDDTPMQWRYTSDAVETYLENSIPYNIALGNHDYFSPYTGIGAQFRQSYYSDFFTVERMMAQYDGIDWARYGGSFSEDSTENMYMFFDAGTPTVHYIVIILEYGPRQEVVDWTCALLEKYSDYNAIILTHAYFNTDGTKTTYSTRVTGGDFADAYEGVDIWNVILDKYDNVLMINCGHSQNQQVQAHVDENSKGKEVIQILSDPSAMVSGFPSSEGLIELMCVTNSGKMHTYLYSPVKGMFRETQFEATFDWGTI